MNPPGPRRRLPRACGADARQGAEPEHSPAPGAANLPWRYTQMMSQSSAKARSVTVDLPDEVFHRRSWDPQEIAEEMLILWLLEEVRSRRLGFGKAAELAGLPQARFLLLMGKHGITPFDYDESELAQELGRS